MLCLEAKPAAYLDVDLAHHGVDLRPGTLHSAVTVESDRRAYAREHVVVLQPRSAHSTIRERLSACSSADNLQVDHDHVRHPDAAQREPGLVDAAELGGLPRQRGVLPALKSALAERFNGTTWIVKKLQTFLWLPIGRNVRKWVR